MQPLDRFAANDDVARLMHSTAESVVRSDLDENGGEPAVTRLGQQTENSPDLTEPKGSGPKSVLLA